MRIVAEQMVGFDYEKGTATLKRYVLRKYVQTRKKLPQRKESSVLFLQKEWYSEAVSHMAVIESSW
jgi:hypothetical protein